MNIDIEEYKAWLDRAIKEAQEDEQSEHVKGYIAFGNCAWPRRKGGMGLRRSSGRRGFWREGVCCCMFRGVGVKFYRSGDTEWNCLEKRWYF